MDNWAILSSVSAGIATLIAAIAIWQNAKISKEQQALTITIHKQQQLLAQRQILLPLWEYISQLNDINPQDPVWLDVIKAVNILELVAVSFEGQLIDENIIRRIFSKQYIEFYQKIEECRNPPENVSMDGRRMLLENPATTRLYQQLMDEHINRNTLSPI